MKSFYAAIFAVNSVFLLQGCSEPQETAEKLPPLVSVTKVQPTNKEPLLNFPSIAVASDKTTLSFRLSGEVENILVKSGDLVEKGQLLAELDDNDYRLEVDDAQALFNIANSKYRRSAKLLKNGYIAQSQFDELKAELRIAKARLDIAKLNLSFAQLKSPFDGIISFVNVEAFENVLMGQSVVHLHRTDAIDIQIQAPDIVYSKQSVDKGNMNKPDATVITPNGGRYSATLKEFTTELDPTTGSYLITLTMPMPRDNFILDGTALDVSVDAEELKIYRSGEYKVPLSAVFNGDGDSVQPENKFVWIVGDDNKVIKRKVATSHVVSDGIRLLNGVEDGDIIVVAGGNRISEGQVVRIFAPTEQ